MRQYAHPRMTPWVFRLIITNAVVLLLMETVLTSGAFMASVALAPDDVLRRPWTLVTYMFVHGGLVHLLLNSLVLYMFGAPVEQRMGSSRFLSFYFLCGVGAAIFAVLLQAVFPMSRLVVGASGAVLGVTVAFAMLWPDAELLLFPIPIPLKARTLAIALVSLDALMAVVSLSRGSAGIAYDVHLGGALAAWIWFRAQSYTQFRPASTRRPAQRPVPVPHEGEAHAVLPQRPRRRVDADPVAAEMDRVLDKISAHGMESLTPAERKFLDDVAEKKKRESH